ncbi:MAG: putative cytochrome c4 [Herbaspirillum sp.]|jgi:cytochrome c553|nr:putative cytochrome c4 [Herbaspirillum sp.]
MGNEFVMNLFFSGWCRAAIVSAALAAGMANAQTPAAAGAKIPDTIEQRAAACIVCHGKQGRAGSDGYYPRIAGKPAGYLYNQLINFRGGQRKYPVMAALIANMSDDYLRELAQFFSDQHPPYPEPQPSAVNAEQLARGQQLVTKGGGKAPACVACHGAALTGVAPTIPGLIGLPRDYLLAQLGAWKNGSRHSAAPDCMAQVVQDLSGADISDAASWLAAQRVPADARPMTALPDKLPLACGSALKEAVK